LTPPWESVDSHLVWIDYLYYIFKGKGKTSRTD